MKLRLLILIVSLAVATGVRAQQQATKVQARLGDLGPLPGTVRENPKDGLKYVWIPPGTFMMGCSPGDSDCGDEEKPPHQVTITKGFWLGQTEVTVGGVQDALPGRQEGRCHLSRVYTGGCSILGGVTRPCPLSM